MPQKPKPDARNAETPAPRTRKTGAASAAPKAPAKKPAQKSANGAKNGAASTSRAKKTTAATPKTRQSASTAKTRQGASATSKKRQNTAPGTAARKRTPKPTPRPEAAEPLEPAAPPTEEEKQSAALVAVETPAESLPVAGGAAVETTLPPVEFPDLAGERRHFWGALMLLLGLAAVVAVSVLIFLYRPNAYAARTDSVVFLYSESEDATRIAVNGSVAGEAHAGRCTASASDASGRTAAAVIGGTLYLVNGRRVTPLCENVTDFFLSQNGNAVAYRTADDLLYYCAVTREPQSFRVSKDARSDRYCLSPNGKELFYTYVEEESARIAVYSTTNHNPHFTTAIVGLVPIAVADNCEFLYYADAETGTLYYLDPTERAPVVCYGGEGEYTLLFNRDLSELLIDAEGGTQFWKNGQRTVIPLLENKAHLRLLPDHRAVTRDLPGAAQVLVDTFEKSYYLQSGTTGGGTSLVYLGRKGKLTAIHAVAEGTVPVTTDKGVYFLSEEKRDDADVRRLLYRCKRGKTGAEALIRANVVAFCMNTDGSRLLYVGRENDLYSLSVGATVPKRLADDVRPETLCVTADDVFYCYLGETLYASDNGDSLRAVRGDTQAAIADAHTAYFFVQNEDETFSVYANHRGRRSGDTLLGSRITEFS